MNNMNEKTLLSRREILKDLALAGAAPMINRRAPQWETRRLQGQKDTIDTKERITS